MAPEKLPQELEEEILIRTQPTSLSRLRAVCKRWNSLFNDKRFVINNLNLARPRPEFIIQSESKTYSLSVNLDEDDPHVTERELTLDNPSGLESHQPHALFGECDGLLLCKPRMYNIEGGALMWNPLLKVTRWIELPYETRIFIFRGLGYDNRKPEKSYKILGLDYDLRYFVYEFLTNAWKSIDANQEILFLQVKCSKVSSINGNLYWTACNSDTEECCIICFDCSLEIFKRVCALPCTKSNRCGNHFLGVFKGDRLFFLPECYGSEKTEVWVTKNKIDDSVEGKAVVWMIFMTVTIPNNMDRFLLCPAYFIEEIHYDKSLVMCYSDESGNVYIYIVKGDVYKTIGLGYKVLQQHHCITYYIPSLVPIPM